MPFSIPPVNAPLAADYTPARAELLDLLERLSILDVAGGAGELTAARAALLANLSLLDAPISSTAPIGSALSTAQWSNARAAFLDRLALLEAGGAGELTAARAAALEALVSTSDLRAGTSGVSIVYPAKAGGASANSGTPAWNPGNYAELVAATPAAGVIVGYQLVSGDNADFEIEFAVGAAMSEVIIGRATCELLTAAGGLSGVPLVKPLKVASGARISYRSSSNPGVSNTKLKIIWAPTPY